MCPGLTLEEISIGKQIRTKLEQCTYEQLYNVVTSPPKEYPSPFNLLKVIHSILSPAVSGDESAEEHNAQQRRNLTRELAIEVIAEKYPKRKQPTQLGDYL